MTVAGVVGAFWAHAQLASDRCYYYSIVIYFGGSSLIKIKLQPTAILSLLRQDRILFLPLSGVCNSIILHKMILAISLHLNGCGLCCLFAAKCWPFNLQDKSGVDRFAEELVSRGHAEGRLAACHWTQETLRDYLTSSAHDMCRFATDWWRSRGDGMLKKRRRISLKSSREQKFQLGLP